MRADALMVGAAALEGGKEPFKPPYLQ